MSKVREWKPESEGDGTWFSNRVSSITNSSRQFLQGKLPHSYVIPLFILSRHWRMATRRREPYMSHRRNASMGRSQRRSDPVPWLGCHTSTPHTFGHGAIRSCNGTTHGKLKFTTCTSPTASVSRRACDVSRQDQGGFDCLRAALGFVVFALAHRSDEHQPLPSGSPAGRSGWSFVTCSRFLED